MVGVEGGLAQFYVFVSKDSGRPLQGNDDGWAAHVDRFTVGVASASIIVKSHQSLPQLQASRQIS